MSDPRTLAILGALVAGAGEAAIVLYNVLGGAMILVGSLVGWGVGALRGGEIDVLWACLAALVADVAWRQTAGKAAIERDAEAEAGERLRARFKSKPAGSALLFHPRAGGHVFFAPIWLLASAVAALLLLGA